MNDILSALVALTLAASLAAAALLIARGARHLYRASGALIDHMTGPEMVRAARHWEENR